MNIGSISIFENINFQAIFEDIPNPVVLIHGCTPVRLNEAANVLCSSMKSMVSRGSDSCSNLNLYSFLGPEIEDFRKSGLSRDAITKEIRADKEVLYLHILIKSVSDDRQTLLFEFMDVTDSEAIKNGMKELADGVLSDVGDKFFSSLATHIVKATGADHSIICEYGDYTKTTLRTVAAVINGVISPNFIFQIDDTPCQMVLNEGLKQFESGVKEKFVNTDMAQALQVDSYFGIPLKDSKDRVMGLMAIMGKQALHNSSLAISILKLFAIRASAELERRLIEKTMESNLLFQKTLIESIPNPIFYKDLSGRYIGCNTALEEYIGFDKEYIIGKKLNELTSEDWKNQCARTDRQLISKGRINPYESKIVMPDRTVRNVIVTKALFSDSDGNTQGIVGTFLDITERKTAEDKIEKLAYYDILTGLPNRLLLQDRLDLQIKHASRNSESFAVFFIDLDRFKNINDTLGHSAGDKLLNSVAELLKNSVRSCDTVARIGGDEFIVVVTNSEFQAMSRLAEKLLDLLSESHFINGHEVFTSLSIGISLFPNDGIDAETLLKNADAAMYQAKQSGRNTYQFFSKEMNEDTQMRLEIENDLRRAISKNSFFVEYQPQVSASDRHITGVEALIRWNHPDKGIIYPNSFISLAEETGLIIPIGDWVFRNACEHSKRWVSKKPGFITCVNISVIQFKHKSFLDKIRAALDETGARPENMELELTESILMSNTEETLKTLDRLKQMGFRLAIDDFGTGYSSLNYVRHFRIDRLKIDKSFITDIKDNNDNAAITKAIIAMAESLQLDVIAEGVETADELNKLIELNCQDIQGFLFSKPISADLIDNLL